MKRKIYLDGELGEKFGKVLTLDVKSFVDVFRAIECQRPEMRQYLVDCHEKKIGFIMHVEDKPLQSEEEILLHFEEGDMYISPAPEGSGGKLGSVFKVVVGAIFILAGASIMLIPGFQGFGAALFGFGLGLLTDGLARLLAPDPATDSQDSRQDSSYLFQGSGQTILEGDPVPVLYGRLRIPGRTIDFDIRNKNSVYNMEGFGTSGFEVEVTPPGNPQEIEPGGPPVTPPRVIPREPGFSNTPGQNIIANIGTTTIPDIVFDPNTIGL